MKKIIIFIVFICALLSFPSAGLGFVLWQVFDGDYTQFSKEKILEILSKETLLYYSDGDTQLGSLFGQEHRIYITIDRVPQVMKDAIVSAEDEGFYSNMGIDPKGIVRAAIHNMMFKTRQGASTITQQTVKNLYGRKDSSLKTKFQETINAFKLEKLYTKDQILEFYLNQFHVTGNGRGIGVAAKYYFDKDVEQLNLVEAAFIAGSVKGPEKYNPFTKGNAKAQERAKHDAFIRKNYVLERMHKNNKITQEQYDQAIDQQVPFNQGRFQFNELAVNQIIMKQLSRPEVLRAIGVNTVDEIGTMGLHITTTIDKSTQDAAQYGLRQNLSRMHMILKGFAREPQENFVNVQKPELYGFYVAKIDKIDATENAERIQLNFGIPTCNVDTNAVNRVAINIDQAVYAGLKKSKRTVLSGLSVGDTVLASVREVNANGSLQCDLEVRPRVQGAALVLDKGKIVAMAGGFSSNEYNRALFAERQPGSTFKLPVYYAGLQLGWTVLDPIPNMRDVFPWQGEYYFPRPDHPQQTLETTILGAGSKSENLASIWLLRHLLDKVSYNQFQDLLAFLEIGKPNDPSKQLLATIGKKFAAKPDDSKQIKETILENLKSDLMSDLGVISNDDMKVFVRTLHYGEGFDAYAETLLEDKELTLEEKNIRLNLLNNNLIRWHALAEQEGIAYQALVKLSKDEPVDEHEASLLSSFGRIVDSDVVVFRSDQPWQPNVTSPLVPPVKSLPLRRSELLAFFKADPDAFKESAVLLDSVVPVELIDTLTHDLETTFNDVMQRSPLEKLYWNADLRYSMAMLYTSKMVKIAGGIQKQLQWVPSFPLGSNDVTLAELSLLYQTFLTGKIYRYFDTKQTNQLLVIKRIEDFNGNLIWEPAVKEYQLVDNFYTPSMLDTMRATITAGTGYSLNWNVLLSSNDFSLNKNLASAKIRVPIFGKTGTSNNFTNATFIGSLPYPTDDGQEYLSPQNAYTIATYIGFDGNEPMTRGSYHAYGGAAIPGWEKIAVSIIKAQKYAEKIDWKSLKDSRDHVVPFDYGSSLSTVVVPVHSSISLFSEDLNEDADGIRQSSIYANDYSDTGQRLLRVYLSGSSSDGVFLPKRKISFFTPAELLTQLESEDDVVEPQR